MEFLLEYWAQWLLGLVSSGVLIYFRKKIKNIERFTIELNAQKAGIVALLRNSLIREHDKHTERGYIPFYASQNIQDMFDAYKNLGGNGAVCKIVEEMKSLPVRKYKRVEKD